MIVVSVSSIVIYGEHMGGDGFVALGTESEERHGVTMFTRCVVKGKFLQIVTEGEVLEEEVCVQL